MDADTLRDLFREFGAIDVRRMFSGAGVFVDGLMIALIARDVIYLKADVQTIPAFEAEGLDTFRYATRNGEHALTSYWRMPERLYDEPDELARWARDAQAAAQRAQTRPAGKSKRAAGGKAVGKSGRVRRRASRSPTSRPRGRSRT